MRTTTDIILRDPDGEAIASLTPIIDMVGEPAYVLNRRPAGRHHHPHRGRLTMYNEITLNGLATQLRRRGATVQQRQADGPMDAFGTRDWGEWRTTHRCSLKAQADAIIARIRVTARDLADFNDSGRSPEAEKALQILTSLLETES